MGTVVLLVLGVVSFIFAQQIVTLFRRDDLQVIEIGTLALRLQLCTLPLWAYITMSNMFTQSIGYGLQATLISIARQGIFLIPLLLILPPALGLLGIQLAQPISDVCTCVFAYFIASRVIRELKGKADK